jgi:2,4-dienoyl-CoA reductase (NADPH2)
VGPGRTRLRLITDWLAAECARAGVEIELGRHVDVEGLQAARQDGWEVVLATGSRPFPNRYVESSAPRVIDALGLLVTGTAGLEGPVVIDDPVGDAVGVGIAEWLAETTDLPVTLVTGDPVAGTLLARTGDLADANVRLQRAGVTRHLRGRVTAVSDGKVCGLDVWTGESFTRPAAVLVDCGHRLPDDDLYLRLGDPRIPRAGDCVAPRTLHEAVLEGRRVAFALVGGDALVVAGDFR